MINKFLDNLVCINCNNKIKINIIISKKKRIKKGNLSCKKCNKIYPIINGVIDFSENKKKTISDVYTKYWNEMPINFDRTIDKAEINIFKSIDNSLRGKIIFDAGCGDGRLIPILNRHKPKLLIVADFSDIIFFTANKYQKIFNDFPILFIKIDLSNKFISKSFFDTVISLGSINFKINQSKIVKNLDSITKNLLVLGLVSNVTCLGKFYQNLNPIRYLFKLKIIFSFIALIKFIILNKVFRRVKLISIFGDYIYSFLELLMSPIILRNKNRFYENLIKKKKLKLVSSKFLDYLLFQS